MDADMDGEHSMDGEDESWKTTVGGQLVLRELEERKPKGARLEMEREVEKTERELDHFLDHLSVRTYSRPRFNPRGASISVVVGREGIDPTFHIHEELLQRESGFFAAALRRGWKESLQKVVRLPEDDPFLFDIFVNFLYSGSIYSTEGCEYDREAGNDLRNDPAEWDRLAFCWIMGDKLAAPRFQDAIIDAIVHKLTTTNSKPLKLPVIAYSRTSGDNPLKHLAVDIAVWSFTDKDAAAALVEHGEYHPQFQRDVISRLKKRCSELSERTSYSPVPCEPWRHGTCNVSHMHGEQEEDDAMYPYPRRSYECYNWPLKLGGSR